MSWSAGPDPATAAAAEPTPAVAGDVFGTALPRAGRYVDLLLGAGTDRGLIGPREAGRIWSRHVLPSAILAEVVPDAAVIADLGSGAGLPGIPIALTRTDATVVLVEPMARRASFLTEVVDVLDLTNAQVVRARAEQHAITSPGRYHVVVARAVTDLGALWGWARPLLRPGGALLAVKGARAAAEVAAAAPDLRRGLGSAEILELGRDNPATTTTVVRVTGRPT